MSFLLPLMGIRHASADLPPVLHHLSIKLQSCCAGPDEMPGKWCNYWFFMWWSGGQVGSAVDTSCSMFGVWNSVKKSAVEKSILCSFHSSRRHTWSSRILIKLTNAPKIAHIPIKPLRHWWWAMQSRHRQTVSGKEKKFSLHNGDVLFFMDCCHCCSERLPESMWHN